MKKLFAFFFLTLSALVFAEKMPNYYLDFGISQDDIISEMSDPASILADGHLIYNYLTDYNAFNNVLFVLDDDQCLSEVSVSIFVPYNSSIQIKTIIDYYYVKYKEIYGDPYAESDNVIIWKYDNGFVIYMDTIDFSNNCKITILCEHKKNAEAFGLESLYANN